MISRRSFLGLCAAAPLAGKSGWWFERVPNAASGIGFVHNNARSEARHLPETVGAGCAFLDYDNDGWMDIFLVNSGPCDFWKPEKAPRHALYRNNRDGTFTDVTEKAGLATPLTFGMGVAVGDYDNDGHADLYLTGYGRNVLYRNNGDGTFTDVTAKAGVAAPNWSTSAVWFDYDNDGKLDLFVCSFVEYSANGKVFCGDNTLNKRYYCIPRVFRGRPSFLFHNNGDGTFTDVSKASGIAAHPAKAHGVVATDVNNDGLLDLFVANDTVANHLFLNRGKGQFEEIGFASGVAFNEHGQARSGMGVDSAPFFTPRSMDLFVANVDRERFSLYRNLGDETFADTAGPTGIAEATQLLSGWGLKFADFDNDGELELILANGHPDDMVNEYSRNVTYRERLLFFRKTGGKVVNLSDEAGEDFPRLWPARGLAVGDFNNDGALDVLINNNGEAPMLLRNLAGKRNNWVGLKLEGKSCNRDAIGAQIVWRAGGQERWRMKTGGGSFLSAHDPREILGLGQATKVDSLEIHWPKPSGRVQTLGDLPANRYLTVVEGVTSGG